MNTRLLTGAKTNDLAVQCVAHTVRLRVLERNRRHDHVEHGRLGHLLDGRHALLEHVRRDAHIIAPLLQRNAVHLARLDGVGLVRRVHLQHAVLAALLAAQNLERLRLVAGRNDTVTHFARNDACCLDVTSVRQRNHVAKAAHAVCTTRACVGRREV